MNLFALRKHFDRLVHPVVSSLARLPLHANAWTMLGAMIGLIGGFAANLTQFNRADGEGYGFVADIVIALDRTNPQVASRLLGSFKSWRMLEPGRRRLAQDALGAVARTPNLSRDVADIAERALA